MTQQNIISSYMIAKYQMLRGVKGGMLKDQQHIIKIISNTKNFPSYHKAPNPAIGGIETHYVSIRDINNWNKKIEKQMKKYADIKQNQAGA